MRLSKEKIAALILLGCMASQVQATMFRVTLDTSVHTSEINEIDIGDQFRIQFYVDDSVVDTDSSDDGGSFDGLSNWSVSKISGTGSWDPTGVSFSSANPYIQISTSSSIEHHLTFVLDGLSGLPMNLLADASTMAFGFFRPAADAWFDVSGTGLSLYEAINGTFTPLDYSDFRSSWIFSDEFTTQYVNGSLRATVNAVPVPAAFWLFGSSLIGLLSYYRKRNRSS